MGVGSRWVQRLKTSTCCAQKAKLEAKIRSQLWQNGPFPSTWAAPNNCGEEENSQDLWQGRARHTQTKSPLKQKRHWVGDRAGGPGDSKLGSSQAPSWGTTIEGNSKETWQTLPGQKTPKKPRQLLVMFCGITERQDRSQGMAVVVLLALGTWQQTLTAPPGSSGDADGQRKGWVGICHYQVKGF